MKIGKVNMLRRVTYLLTFFLLIDIARSEFFTFEKLYTYAKILHVDELVSTNTTDNELWHGLLKDCSKKVTFSCIQKNAYTYLDGALSDRDNITVFDGLTLTKNNLDYGTCAKDIDENLVDGSTKNDCESDNDEDDRNEEDTPATKRRGRTLLEEEPQSPLEEITGALRQKAMKFLVTRDYEIQLPNLIFEGTTMKISPREIDESGALVRLDFNQNSVVGEGRIFKKIKKFIQNKLLLSFLALLLLIKLIKLKFMFVIPFLFGVGAAKKLFLKLLLFLIPPFAHIFKLCSSFYTSHGTKYHHHHHQIAHHHHHVPVPVPVPTYYDHHHHHHDDDYPSYDYAHPHIQYRKDMEELKEWGIEPYDDQYEDPNNKHVPGLQLTPGVLPAPAGPPPPSAYPMGVSYTGPYGLPQYAPNARPIATPTYHDKYPASVSTHAHNLAYSGYLDDKYNRRVVEPNGVGASVKPVNVLPVAPVKPPIMNVKNSYGVLSQSNVRHVSNTRLSKPVITPKNSIVTAPVAAHSYDDEYYGPIVSRLEEIFTQLRFFDESCRERLVCSMYKNPTVYSPHSNLVSNELSRDPQEFKRGTLESGSSQKFHKYLNAARIGQDRGDCSRTYPCHINTE